MHVARYLRISDDRAEGAGVDRQDQDTARIAASRWPGTTTVTYTDNDRSAYKNVKRPAYERLLTAMAAGEVSAVVGYNQDRMFRRPVELEAFIALCERLNFSQFVTAESDIDLTNHEGQLHARIMCAFAMKSSQDTSRRVKRALITARERGHHPGRVPWTVTNPAAAMWAVRQIAAGVSGRVVVDELPRAFPGTPRLANTLSLSKSIQSPRMLADVATTDTDREIVRRVQLIFADPARFSGGSRGVRTHFLTGLLICGACSGKMVHTKNRRGTGQYQCNTCWGVTISDRADTYIAGWLFDARVKLAERTAERTSDGELAALDARLNILAEDYALGVIGRAELEVARAAVNRRRDALRVDLAVTEAPLADRWESMTPADQHDAAARFLTAVRVVPATVRGGRFDPARMTPQWREQS